MSRLTRISARTTFGVVLVVCAACAKLLGADGDYVEGERDAGSAGGTSLGGTGGESLGGAGGVAGAGGTGGGSLGDASDVVDAPVDFCQAFAEKSCDAYEKCCNETWSAYDETGCRQGRRKFCEALSAKADAGGGSIDPSALDECIAAATAQACQLSIYGILLAAYESKACFNLFEGTAKVGEPCDELTPCAQESSGAGVVACAMTTKVCTRIEVVSENSTCPSKDYSAGPNHFKICGEGLVCTSGDICKKAGTISEGCSGPATCADTLYCVLNKCAVGKPPGAPCASSDQCASRFCVPLDGGMVCAPYGSTLSPAICTGTADAAAP